VRRFGHAKHFQSGMLAKKARSHISMDVLYFQSVLHAKICAKYQMWAFFGSGMLRT
jgi:hypothetical protein